eukprot:256950_1
MRQSCDYKPNKHKESEIIRISEKSSINLIIISKLLTNTNNIYIPIMMVREPLMTILSGYNYHSQGSETKWTNVNLFSSSAQYKRGNVPLIYCFRDIFNASNEYVINTSSTMYFEY